MKNYFLRGIPKELWKKVKILCAERDITIKSFIIDLIEKEIEREGLR